MPVNPKLQKSGAPAQIDAFTAKLPEGQLMITPGEIAIILGCSSHHVLNLIEDGSLAALNISGRYKVLRIPVESVPVIAKIIGVQESALAKAIATAAPPLKRTRDNWRVPVEALRIFIREAGSLNL